MLDFLKSILVPLVLWVTRPRNIGLKFIGFGALLVCASIGVDWLGQFDYRDEYRRVSFKFGTGDAVAKWVTYTAFGIGLLLITIGIGVGLYSYIVELRQNSRKKAVVVEIRGLHSSPDTPARDANLGDFPRARESLRLDFRPRLETELVSPELALQKISGMKGTIQLLVDGRDLSDVTLAVGGLAAVPALFLAGLLLDDETAITLYDWQRDAMRWRRLDGVDDGKRLLPFDVSALPVDAREVVLACSLSYRANLTAVNGAFPTVPLVELIAEEVIADSYWSEEKQQAVVGGFRAAVQTLLHRDVQRIHLVLAAPASLSIRLGMAYDRRLFPELLVYQYERSASPAYPWAFSMPTHGQPEAQIVFNPKR